MPTVHLSPIGNDAPFYANGAQLSGGQLFTYLAGTTTPATTYTDEDAGTANANPIVLNSEGYPSSAGARVQVWLIASTSYKFVLKDADSLTLWSMDDIDGINDIAQISSEWVSTTNNVAPTFVSAVSFTLVGDHTADALRDRWLKLTSGGGTAYGIITASAFTTTTLVTFVNVSGTVTSPDSVVQWGLLRPDHPSVPLDDANLKATTITAAATTEIWKINGNYAHITGATGITSFSAPPKAGARRRLTFDTGLTITHNASTLICPGGTSLAVGANDMVEVIAESTASVRVASFTPGLPPGVVMDFGGTSAPSGWLECDGSAVSRTTYAPLFAAISSNYGVGDGSSTFNLPDFRGRARVGRGTGTYVSRFTQADIDTGTNVISVPVNNSLITGTSVVYNAGVVANPLVDATTYFIIRASSTSVKLATTLALAQAGTEIDITTTGTGSMTLTVTLTARTVGQVGGEEAHAMSSTEDYAHIHTGAAHTHAQQNGNSAGTGTFPIIATTNTGDAVGAFGGAGLATQGASAGNTGSAGGNAAMNIMQPFSITMAIIKT